jgi:glycosyltransferase involved in cell wall biosynthesis
MTKLTVAIPNYNGGNNLKRAIESCRNIKSSKKNYEILVVDNKSTDNSLQIVDDLKKEFPNLRLIKNQTNVGRIKNWNVCIDNSQGDFLVYLFTNDMISENNNINQILEILDSDSSISLCLSSFLKKEKEREYIKKKFFEKIVSCPSDKFVKYCLERGLMPFGPIQGMIYRLDDIHQKRNYFIETMPINADEIFSYVQASMRKNILFNPTPQIIWDQTKERFHGKMKFEDEVDEHSETVEIIKKQLDLDVNFGLISTYRAINLLKFSTSNLDPNQGKKKGLTTLFSKMKEKKTFFNSDSILLKTLIGKLKNSDIDADDLLYKIIISKCFSKNLEIKTMEQVKKINKPWGYEKWIADGSPDFKYALKEILFRANFKSSIQFHEFKEETNYIQKGKGVLHYSSVPIDIKKFRHGKYSEGEIDEIISNLQKQELTPGMVFHVKPGIIHRVEAVEDLTLIESSTIELDDVYRINDEWERHDGKIESEHV